MILSAYTYLYSAAKIAKANINPVAPLAKPVDTIDIDLIGSRMSAKTIQTLKFLIEMSFMGVQVSTDIWRDEPKGAEETYNELCSTAEDIYDIKVNRNNSNTTKRTLILGSNKITVRGFRSNRKKQSPKLGLARKGVKKDIQINVFEEATEFSSIKDTEMIKQATGGAKVIINIRIANPWVLSNWYVSAVNNFLPFHEKTLRTKGQQYKEQYIAKDKTLKIAHITNHRINTYLAEAQHRSLTNLWNIDEQLARVADLGMPGVSEGLIYAPVMHNITAPTTKMATSKFRAGIDVGLSTGEKASSTGMVIGRIGKNNKLLSYDQEYFHSNSRMYYKDQPTMIADIVKQLMAYAYNNREAIRNSDTGVLEVFYDFMAFGWGELLKQELRLYERTDRLTAELIQISPCVKFKVPTRIKIVLMLMAQGRIAFDKDKCPNLWKEYEEAMWDDTREVKGMPTRVNFKDDLLDAAEYMIGDELMSFADADYLTAYKTLDKSSARASF